MSYAEIQTFLETCFAWFGGILQSVRSSSLWPNLIEDDRILSSWVLCFLLIGIVVEALDPKNRAGKRTILFSYRTNLCLFVCNNLALSLLSITVLYTFAERYAGLDPSQGPILWSAGWWIAFIVIDFFLYAWHFASHHVPMLWMFHKVHHSDQSMNVTTAVRFHAGELVLTTLFKALLIVLLRLPVTVILTTEAIIACFTLFHHTNVKFRFERILKWVFIVPGLHRTHHSTKRSEHDSNYGSVFSIWDRIFGTLHELIPDSIGLAGVRQQTAWQAFLYGLSPSRAGNAEPAAPEVLTAPVLEIGQPLSCAFEQAQSGQPQSDFWEYFDILLTGKRPVESFRETENGRESKPQTDSYGPMQPFEDWRALYAFSLDNINRMQEVTDYAWRVQFAVMTAWAKVATVKPDKRAL